MLKKGELGLEERMACLKSYEINATDMFYKHKTSPWLTLAVFQTPLEPSAKTREIGK